MDYYEIIVKGHLGDIWEEGFKNLDLILRSDGDSLLSGYVEDQAELYGIIDRLRDMGLILKKVHKKE